jgi:hypothetical protein
VGVDAGAADVVVVAGVEVAMVAGIVEVAVVAGIVEVAVVAGIVEVAVVAGIVEVAVVVVDGVPVVVVVVVVVGTGAHAEVKHFVSTARPPDSRAWPTTCPPSSRSTGPAGIADAGGVAVAVIATWT